jgi:hypothetical protein
MPTWHNDEVRWRALFGASKMDGPDEETVVAASIGRAMTTLTDSIAHLRRMGYYLLPRLS